MNYQVFDMHVHVFPDVIAKKAASSTGQYYGVSMFADGTWAAFEDSMKNTPEIEKCLIHSTATKAAQVEHVNEFVAGLMNEKLFSFGSMHPDYPAVEKEIDRMLSLGLKGIKLHPDFQGFAADDAKAFPIYAYAQGKLPILFHVGDRKSDFSSPKRLRNIHDRFPGLTMICAHLGGYAVWDEAEKYLVGQDVYFDTSSCLEWLEKEQAVRIIRNHGADKCLFGTDFPMHDPKKCIETHLGLGLTETEYRKIFWENAHKLLCL
ncbi:MAG: amidohydrolase [Ruminococcaceae bacterium]|nr:amidohydrolase [Oscillospiraceae bacterium]